MRKNHKNFDFTDYVEIEVKVNADVCGGYPAGRDDPGAEPEMFINSITFNGVEIKLSDEQVAEIEETGWDAVDNV